MKIVMLGAPGSGKGTQARFIEDRYHIPQISTGNIFRYNIKQRTPLGEKAKAYMDKGQLVPDQLVVDLVMNRLQQEDCKDGYILDGFPRTIPQAKALDQALRATDNQVNYAIEIFVEEEEIVNRMTGRRACLDCGATYHIETMPTKVDGICDICGGKTVLRDDDKPETVLERLEVYNNQTKPLIEYYESEHILYSVDGTKDVAVIAKDIASILGEA